VRYFIKSSRWWRSTWGRSGKVFFNKRYYLILWRYWTVLLHLSPLAGHGGEKRGSTPTMFCSNRRGRGVNELIHVVASLASTILCRQGGDYPICEAEALRTHCWSLKALRH
jgi:hypothetical protein